MDTKRIYGYFIAKNLLILRKSGVRANALLFITCMIIVSFIIPLLYKYYMKITLKTMVIFSMAYLASFLSLPSMLYEMKIEKFEKNLPKALYLMSLSLESGRSVTEAMEEVITNGVKEVDKEFMKILYMISEKKFSFDDAMTTITSNSDSAIFKQLGRLIIENKKYGGELSKSLKSLAKTLEDMMSLKQQLLSTTANGLAVGLVILCGVIPATSGLIGCYLNVLSQISPVIPAPKPEDIARCSELIQLGTGIFGLLFAVPLFGLKLNRMIIICSICMSAGVLVFYGIMKGASYIFT